MDIKDILKGLDRLLLSLDKLKESQAKTDEQMKKTDEKVDKLKESQAKTDEQMKKTDEKLVDVFISVALIILMLCVSYLMYFRRSVAWFFSNIIKKEVQDMPWLLASLIVIFFFRVSLILVFAFYLLGKKS